MVDSSQYVLTHVGYIIEIPNTDSWRSDDEGKLYVWDSTRVEDDGESAEFANGTWIAAFDRNPSSYMKWAGR